MTFTQADVDRLRLEVAPKVRGANAYMDDLFSMVHRLADSIEAELEREPFTREDVELLLYLSHEAVGYGDGKLGPQDPEIIAQTEALADRIEARLE